MFGCIGWIGPAWLFCKRFLNNLISRWYWALRFFLNIYLSQIQITIFRRGQEAEEREKFLIDSDFTPFGLFHRGEWRSDQGVDIFQSLGCVHHSVYRVWSPNLGCLAIRRRWGNEVNLILQPFSGPLRSNAEVSEEKIFNLLVQVGSKQGGLGNLTSWEGACCQRYHWDKRFLRKSLDLGFPVEEERKPYLLWHFSFCKPENKSCTNRPLNIAL